MPNRRRSIEQVYQLDVRLAYIDPPIWRRILVSDQILLPGLHHLLQVVMGWEHSHLYQFIIGTTRYGETDPEFDDGMQSDRRMRLRDIAAEKGASFLYEYDFGDGWRHLITVEDLWPRTEYDIVPRCLDGERACPRRTRAVSGDMNTCWRCCATSDILSTKKCARGQGSISIRPASACNRSTPRWVCWWCSV